MPWNLPKGLRNARKLCFSAAAAAFAADPELTVSEWADRYRVLSSKSSSDPGRWRTDKAPYMREIMDAMSPSHPCTDGDFQKGTQIAGSEGMYNVIGTYIDRVPCPIMLVMPTRDMAKATSQERVQPMIHETPSLANKIAESRSRDSGNTVLRKDFSGGILVFAGANSGPALRSRPVRVLLEDEIDAYPDDVDGEGDPCAVAEKRTDTFGARAKRMRTSTPKLKGKSRIDRRYKLGTQALYYVPCPHCNHEQTLRWEQMRWEMLKERELVCSDCGSVTELEGEAAEHAECPACRTQVRLDPKTLREFATDEIERVWYECESCRGDIEEHHKQEILLRGRHVHHNPGAGEWLDDDDPHPHAIWAKQGERVRRFLPRFTKALSWKVPALYSLLGFTWWKAVQEYIDAQRGGFNEETGESLDQVFHNTVLAEAYEVAGEQPVDEVLKLRAEPYRLGLVPAGALVLTAACDVQGNRLEVKVKGYGRGEESWLIDYQVLYGDPKQPEVWAQLIELRDQAYMRESGATMRITTMAIDSGYLSQEVYAFARKWQHKEIFATKGQAQQGKPLLGRPVLVDIDHRGEKVKHGVQLWPIGADTAKERIYKRLEIDPIKNPGPGAMHFPAGLPDEYFQGLASEKLVRKRVKGQELHEWVKTVERNEPLDLEVLCYAGAVRAGIQRNSFPWDNLERVIAQGDLFAVRDQAEKGPGDEPAPITEPPPDEQAAEAIKPAERGLFHGRESWIGRRQNWLGR